MDIPKELHECDSKFLSVENIFESKPNPPTLPSRGTKNIPIEEQQYMLHSIQSLIEQVDYSDGDERVDVDKLGNTCIILLQLWQSASDYMAQAVEIMANASRECKGFIIAISGGEELEA